MILTIIYFIFILGVTVFIHELGHFLFAKKFGVYVYEFSIGMGPRLFKFKRKNDETDYSIRLLPIGGYVQMAGEDIEVDKNIPKDKLLQSYLVNSLIIRSENESISSGFVFLPPRVPPPCRCFQAHVPFHRSRLPTRQAVPENRRSRPGWI